MARALDVEAAPNDVARVVISQLYVSSLLDVAKRSGPARVVLKSTAGASQPIMVPVLFFKEAAQRTPPMIALLAIIPPDGSQKHWLIVDYTKGLYELYGNYGVDEPGKVGEGYAPILEDIDEYNVTGRPHLQNLTMAEAEALVGSPIVIVVNPTYAIEDWTFTWRDSAGTWRFHVPALKGDIEIDYLFFWEDQYYPPQSTDNLDDWKDHVVRVTMFTNGTYRLAVHRVKGDFKHRFYIQPLQVLRKDISEWEGKYVYEKDFGEYWPSDVPLEAYPEPCNIYEPADRVYYKTIQG